jgi:hypothetical protein
MQIHDGRTNDTAHVDANNKLAVAAITDPIQDFAADVGVKYNINTGDVTLTDATATSVLYIKNNEDDPLIITSLIYNLGTSTNGTGDAKIDVYRNPTAGTIIDTTPTDVDIGPGVTSNQNFGNTRLLAADMYKGTTADDNFTASDGISISTRHAAGTGRIVIALGAILLPKGASLGVTITPPASNTSQVVQVAAACYLKTQKVEAT